jgi:hypothetical protein
MNMAAFSSQQVAQQLQQVADCACTTGAVQTAIGWSKAVTTEPAAAHPHQIAYASMAKTASAQMPLRTAIALK